MKIRFRHCIIAATLAVSLVYISVEWSHSPNRGFLAFWSFSAYEIVGLLPEFLFSAMSALCRWWTVSVGERENRCRLALASIYAFLRILHVLHPG